MKLGRALGDPGATIRNTMNATEFSHTLRETFPELREQLDDDSIPSSAINEEVEVLARLAEGAITRCDFPTLDRCSRFASQAAEDGDASIKSAIKASSLEYILTDSRTREKQERRRLWRFRPRKKEDEEEQVPLHFFYPQILLVGFYVLSSPVWAVRLYQRGHFFAAVSVPLVAITGALWYWKFMARKRRTFEFLVNMAILALPWVLDSLLPLVEGFLDKPVF